MPVSGKGDLEALRKLVSRLPGEARVVVVKSCAQEARLLAEEGFEQGKAPSGAPWAPLKARQGQPLRDSGRLLASLVTIVGDLRFEVTTAVRYAVFQNKGTKYIPARQFLPDTAPAPWLARLTEAGQDAVDALSKKVR